MLSAQSGNGAIITPLRRFPPPWVIEENNNACFIVCDNTGQALGYFYFENEPGRRAVAKLLTRDEARPYGGETSPSCRKLLRRPPGHEEYADMMKLAA